MTGEAVPVKKTAESYVYAGTVVEEGELIICVKAVSKATRFEKIVTMIEESEKLKSNLESHAEHLADQTGSVYTGRNDSDLAADKRCDQGTGSTDGRFFVCTQAGDSNFGTVCDPGGGRT